MVYARSVTGARVSGEAEGGEDEVVDPVGVGVLSGVYGFGSVGDASVVSSLVFGGVASLLYSALPCLEDGRLFLSLVLFVVVVVGAVEVVHGDRALCPYLTASLPFYVVNDSHWICGCLDLDLGRSFFWTWWAHEVEILMLSILLRKKVFCGGYDGICFVHSLCFTGCALM
ncbi:hypothetical protein SUGI_0982570 [Cryptomeria japonica]|nr:hypothetical protein SUGI_0982570 [Cryptomeria japonica]